MTSCTPRTVTAPKTGPAAPGIAERPCHCLLWALSVTQQRGGYHQPLDLAGPLVDLGDLRVAEVALDREVGEVAVAAEDLHRLLGGPVGHLGGEHLGHGGVGGEARALVLLDRGPPDQ